MILRVLIVAGRTGSLKSIVISGSPAKIKTVSGYLDHASRSGVSPSITLPLVVPLLTNFPA